jgi:hypothetical protein
MLICRSFGTSTIVVLMATHRAGSSTFDHSFPVFDQAAVVRMHQGLMDHGARTEKHVSIELHGNRHDGRCKIAV